MHRRGLVIGVFVGGLVTLVSGYLIDSLDSGSCPADEPNCRHTFQNSKIFKDVGTPMIIVGFAALVAAAIIRILIRLRVASQSEKKDVAG